MNIQFFSQPATDPFPENVREITCTVCWKAMYQCPHCGRFVHWYHAAIQCLITESSSLDHWKPLCGCPIIVMSKRDVPALVNNDYAVNPFIGLNQDDYFVTNVWGSGTIIGVRNPGYDLSGNFITCYEIVSKLED